MNWLPCPFFSSGAHETILDSIIKYNEQYFSYGHHQHLAALAGTAAIPGDEAACQQSCYGALVEVPRDLESHL